MRNMVYEYDKLEDKAKINDVPINKKITFKIKQEFEWDSNIYIIVETRNSLTDYYARGVLKDIYLDSITIKKS